MDLVLANNANSAVELIALGFTVPANDVYDVTSRPLAQIGNDPELTGHIANGTLQLVSNAIASTYYSPADAQQLLTYGVNTSALGLGVVKAIDLGTGPQLYALDPPTGKFLSLGFSKVDFSSANASNKCWLQVSSSFAGTNIGYLTAAPLTATVLSAFSDSATEKSISLYVDDTEYANVIVFSNTYVAGDNITSLVSIDFPMGSKSRYRVFSDTPGSLGAIYLTAYFALKGE